MDEIKIIAVSANSINAKGMHAFQTFNWWSSLFETRVHEVEREWSNRYLHIKDILNIIENKSEYTLLTTYPSTITGGDYHISDINFVFKKKKSLY